MRLLEVHLPADDRFDTVIRAVKAADPIDYYVQNTERKDRKLISVFIREGTGQSLIDNIQTALETCDDFRITVLPVEATAPNIEEATDQKAQKQIQATREEIYSDVSTGARLDRDFIIMVVLSTIVAAIGLNSDGIAAVIGAMVIAPLLGPVLGFSMGAALGDFKLLKRASVTLASGIAIALFCAWVLSFLLEIDLQSRELMSRAEVRLDGLALAMAAGGAAALSLTRGQASALVGVMVAAALLPPGAALGLFVGTGHWTLAMRAGLLLALNVVALVLAALIVFRLRKIRPRSWIDQKNALRAVWINAGLSVLLLAIATALIIWLDLGSEVSVG
ncbi:TIGR00341 family protein [Hyphomonas sp.]|uniref:TIGR00341 family protein n=1 Tax=Hyphomonas sp. TaxID=87 RepID=UPI0025BC850F|nr:TIGR00341 family protein [Hyphomonas sp.]